MQQKVTSCKALGEPDQMLHVGDWAVGNAARLHYSFHRDKLEATGTDCALARREGDGSMNVRFDADILCAADLETSDMAHWRRLQATAPELGSPFFSPEFTLAVAASRQDVRIVRLRAGGDVIGYFPFHRMRAGIGRPIGGPMSDYQGPILPPGTGYDAADLLSACDLNAYDYNHAPAAFAAFARHALAQSFSPRATLAAGFDAYLAGRPPSAMESIKDTQRRLRKLQREKGPVSFVLDDRRQAAWDWLVATKTASLAVQGVKANFDVPWVARMLDGLRAARGADFSGVLSTLSCGDTLIAAHFGLRTANVMCWWHTTYSEDFRQFAPGLGLLLHTLQEADGAGLHTLDFGRGAQRYKLVFANDEIPLCEGSLAIPRSRAHVLRQGHRLAVRLSAGLPLGKNRDLPGRVVGRLVSNVRLPAG